MTEIMENHSQFLCVRETASINLFQVDFDKSWNYVWYCYMKGTCAPVAPVTPVPVSLLISVEYVCVEHYPWVYYTRYDVSRALPSK